MLLDEVEKTVAVEMDVLRTNALHFGGQPELAEVGHVLPVLLHPLVLDDVAFVVVVVA